MSITIDTTKSFSQSNNRNYTLDFIKLIAAYFVVFIHVPFYGILGDIVIAYARAAVPIFFITAGYFCFGKDSKTILRRTKKIAIILLLASLLYIISDVFISFFANGINGIKQYLGRFLSINNWLLLLLLNVPFSATRLWFLLALIYSYLVQLFVNQFSAPGKFYFVISTLGLLAHLAIGNSSILFGIEVPEYICRNFLLTGYPFFALGLLLKQFEDRIISINKIQVLIIGGIGMALSPILVLTKTPAQIGIGTLLLVFALMYFALKCDEATYPIWLIQLFSCSLGIYILHRPVATILSLFLSKMGLTSYPQIYYTIFPITVCIASTVATLLIINLLKMGKSIK